MKSHEFIKESRTSGSGDSPQCGPDPKVQHDFKVGDAVFVPTVRAERRELRKGIVENISPDKIGVAGHNPYYPKSVQWFKIEDVAGTVNEGEQLPSVKTPTVGEIAEKFGYPMSYIMDQLRKGIDVEYEHTTNFATAKEIALDHLAELPDYYDRLEKMERR